jgi:mycothiol maleylpyruvate isomerase-like protein
VAAFLAAADDAAGVLGSEAVAQRWDEPSAVDGFTVGGLAAHVLTATARTEQVLDEPEPAMAEIVDVARFYGANRVAAPGDTEQGLHPVVRRLAADDAARGPDATVSDFTALVERLRERLLGERADRLVAVLQVPGGATPLDVYLATRVVELVVHIDDLAASVGFADHQPPEVAVDVAVDVFVELARQRSGDAAVVRAFTRRERADADVLRVL